MTDSPDHGFIERRRVERKYLVSYLRVFEGGGHEVLGHVVNLSSRGVMLLSCESIPVNENYRLRMRIPNKVGDLRELSLHATSLWCRNDADPGYFLTGFEIARIRRSDKMEIDDILEKLSYLKA